MKKLLSLTIGLMLYLPISVGAYSIIMAPGDPYAWSEQDNLYRLMLSDRIGSGISYFPLTEKLYSLKKTDTVEVYLAGIGGQMEGLLMLTALLQNTKATVKMIVVGNVYSAHSMLMCVGDTLYVESVAVAMFHSPSGGALTKQSDTFKNLNSMRKSFKHFMSKHCSNVVTANEVRDVQNGIDLYLTGTQIMKRIKK